MKDTFSIAVIAAAVAAVAFRLYRKYYAKNAGSQNPGVKKDSSMPSSSKEDEYEPYSKK